MCDPSWMIHQETCFNAVVIVKCRKIEAHSSDFLMSTFIRASIRRAQNATLGSSLRIVNVSLSLMTINSAFALVSATFNRLRSLRKPVSPCRLHRTVTYGTRSKVWTQNALKARFYHPREFHNSTNSTTMPQRLPLTPIDPNRPLKKELSPCQRSEISTLRAVGLTNDQIGKRVFCTRNTVASTLRLNTLRNEGKTRPRSGRPSALSIRDRRLILRIARRNPKITYAVLAIEAGITVHKSTLYRMLKEEGIAN